MHSKFYKYLKNKPKMQNPRDEIKIEIEKINKLESQLNKEIINTHQEKSLANKKYILENKLLKKLDNLVLKIKEIKRLFEKFVQEEDSKKRRKKKESLDKKIKSIEESFFKLEKEEFSNSKPQLFNNWTFITITLFSAGFIITLIKILEIIFDNYALGNYKPTALIFLIISFCGWMIFASKITSFKSLLLNGLYWIILLIGCFILFMDPFNFTLQIIGIIILIAGVILNSVYIPQTTNQKAWVFFLIILFISNIGLAFIDSTYGYHAVKSYLNIDGNVKTRYDGPNSLVCQSMANRIYIGSEVNCTINPPLKEITYANLTLTNLLGKQTKIAMNNKTMNFTAPENNSDIFLEIWGIGEKDEKIYLSTSFEARFYSLEEDKEREEKFLLGIFGLLGLIFISVPQIIKGIEELTRDKLNSF